MKRGPLAAAEASLAADRRAGDPAIWITRVPDAEVLDRARELEREGPMGRPLWGLTVAVKDNIDVAGLPTTAGCPEYARIPEQSAPAVRQLVEAGALLLGKTNLDQFATGLVGTRSPYGTPRNLFNAGHIPGGSSSGSGVAVGAGIVDIALGTDTAGSGRVPAAFNNIVGLKPTVGSISAIGVVPACRSVDTVSVFARTVDLALRAHRVIAGYDAADPYSRALPAGYMRRAASPPATRIAVAGVDALCEPEINRLWRRAAGLFNHETIDASLLIEVARLLYEGPWVAERASALRDVVTTRPEIMHPVTRAIIESGMTRKTVDAFDAFHAVRRARRMLSELFLRCDALLLPTVPFCPTLAAIAADEFEPNRRLGLFTNFVNLCDLAAIAVPAGIGADGLPVGVTVLGPAWSEGRIAAIADHIHRAFTADLPPPSPPDDLAADETALFCVGAHMSGLPLNHQLTERGGRFLRGARTQPVYRLHALGDRPGMARGPGGAAIAGEVWALPTASIGGLLALVPAPLGFGAVALDDGHCLGFLAEAEAFLGTRDITAFGGWRAWLTAKEGSP